MEMAKEEKPYYEFEFFQKPIMHLLVCGKGNIFFPPMRSVLTAFDVGVIFFLDLFMLGYGS